MNIFQKNKNRKNGELRIIGAISIDLNGMTDELKIDQMNQEEQTKVARALLKEFCANSTIHGVRYFTEQKRHWIERIWWIVAFIASVGFCAYTTWNLWEKWQNRPVIVSFDDKTTPIAMIPFPAITICSTRKFDVTQSELDLYEETFADLETDQTIFKKLSKENLNRFDAVIQLCGKEIMKSIDGLKIDRSESIQKTIEAMSPEIGSTVIFSTFMQQLAFSRPIFTAAGRCYTFNVLNSRDIYTDEMAPELMTVVDNPNVTNWDAEHGYELNVNEDDVYPHRVLSSGSRDVFATALSISIDDSHYFCNELSPGFQLSLHTPDQLSRLPDDFIQIPIKQEVHITVKPHMVTTSDGLRKYSSKSRGCFFKSERQLRFFKLYNQHHCELECLANFTKQACGCVRFSMPRDKNTDVCTMVSSRCYFSARDRFLKQQIVRTCNCLPDCTSITYDVEISQAQIHVPDSVIAFQNALNETGKSEANSKLFVSFKENNFISINRTEAYTLSDFIASFGGLLGLCMGVSLLSVIELIYFFTLRLCCKLKQQKSTRAKVFPRKKNKNRLMLKNEFQRRRF